MRPYGDGGHVSPVPNQRNHGMDALPGALHNLTARRGEVKKIPKERKRGNVWMVESGTERHMTARKVRRGRCKRKKHSVICELEESGCHGRAAPSPCAECAAVFPCTHFPVLL